jgi:hypothetical protein
MATNFLPYNYGYEPGEELDPELASLYGGVPMASFPPDVYRQVPDEAPGPPPGSPLEVQPGVPMASAPPFAPPPQQSFGQRLKGAIPRMFNGAIDAMATPNVAGGGAVDMARALQASQGGAQQRDILSYNMARQRERDDMDRQQRQAQAELYRKHGEYYDRMGQAKVAAPKTDIEADLYRDWQAETDPAVKQQKWDRFQQYKHGGSQAKPPDQYEVDEEYAKTLHLRPNKDGKYVVPATALPAQIRADTPKAPSGQEQRIALWDQKYMLDAELAGKPITKEQARSQALAQWDQEQKAHAGLVAAQTGAAGRRGTATGGSGGGSASANPSDAKAIADAIEKGLQPPDTKGLFRFGGPVRAELARRGYDLMAANRDWQAVQRHLSTLNGPQQERLRQAVTFTYDSLDVLENLYKEWQKVGKPSGFKALNRASIAVAKNMPGEVGSVAQALEAQINDLTSELGTVYKGGNSSTDESLRLAAENLKADWNEETFKRQLGLIRKNLQIRKNSIFSSQAVGVREGSPYTPQAPGASGGKLTAEEARGYLQRAGGDKEKARQLARSEGKVF